MAPYPQLALLLLLVSTAAGQAKDGVGVTLYSMSQGKGLYKGMSRQFVDAQNKVRARYSAPPVTWDSELALVARRWSNTNKKACAPKHSGTQYAENIFVGRNAWNSTAVDAVYGWAAEEKYYDKYTTSCTDNRPFGDCGHFAIMVNKKYRYVGCGRVECDQGLGVFITCNYSPLPLDPTTPPPHPKWTGGPTY